MTEGVADKRSTKEQQRLKMIMAVEDDASNPKRIEIISATEYQVTPPYVYWRTVRLRHIDELNKEGMPSEKVDAVMVWRRKCAIFLNKGLVLTILLLQQLLMTRVTLEAQMPFGWVWRGGFILTPSVYYQHLPRRIN